MNDRLKLSVAIATYNGEKYIEKQIRSILSQTYPVDEVIISDDGSVDHTLEVLKKIYDSRITVICNRSGKKGYCGNFENALKHCTGDYIFLADQDDIWCKNKVQRIIDLIKTYPNMSCIFSDGILIDENDNILQGRMNHTIFEEVPLLHLDKTVWLERAVSQTLGNGMAMCISKKLVEAATPFPNIRGGHDQWLIFCSVYLDTCYYLNEKLVAYRLHGNNTAGNSAYKGKIPVRIKKICRRIMKGNLKTTDRVEMGLAMKKYLEKKHWQQTEAYQTAKRIVEIGEAEVDAFRSPKIIGAYKLTYCANSIKFY